MESTLFQNLVESTTDAVMITDARPADVGGPTILYINPAFEQLMGYPADEALGQSPHFLYGPETDNDTYHRICDAMHEGKTLRTEILKYCKDGHARWLDLNLLPLRDPAGEITHFAWIERDLTRYKMLEQQLANMALFDSLTGTLNRPAFYQHAGKEFARSKRYYRPLSVIMLDIDHFKRVNDEYGHQGGDQVLQIFAEACQEVIRATDVMGRVGGEEFALLLPDTPLMAAYNLAERLRARINKYPYLARDMLIEITASLGVAELHPEDKDIRTLLQRADEALYEAKHAGRNRVQSAA
ncbi:MAG: diguanylate cyclase [Gammaproteobacteria bacterium]|jgi:diguanylate cyclase (GGDEF)-like protein/PAS domain S-box-containing protein